MTDIIDSAQLLDELTTFCKSDSLSEGGLRAIIQRHGWTSNHPSVQNYYFFLEACRNERVTEGIIRYLLDNFSGAATFIDEGRSNPLHHICCGNKNVTLGMVRLILDAAPGLRHEKNNSGVSYLHCLCGNIFLDDNVAIDILKLLLERSPESVRHAANDGRLPIEGAGFLPIHLAAMNQSLEFCRILIEEYPGSERMTDEFGQLPFHLACSNNTVATAKYLYELYPESINLTAANGTYPIHIAITNLKSRMNNPEAAIDMVQFLLDCDPNVVLQEYDGDLPLYWVCNEAANENTTPTNLNAYLKILQILYDAHPEAIERDAITTNLDSLPQEVRTFINIQLIYARQARDLRRMNTPGESNGQLPLHRALRDNVRLGSIKLLVKGNPSAIRCYDKRGTTPLHVACQHHESASVVQYLVELDRTNLRARDFDDNTVLHYACRGANHKTIALLLDRYGAVSVSKRNTNNQLPIDLLFESNVVSDREGIEYTESIFRLLGAYPATVMDCIPSVMPQVVTSNVKKRKVDSR